MIREAYVSMGKQNGKSFLTGGLPIYHLLMEDEQDPEAYGCAAAKEQAGIVYKAAAKLVKANPNLSSINARHGGLKVLDSVKRIVRRDGAGFYQVLSADGDVQDGIRPSLLIRDEIHRWKTMRAETLKDVTTKGQISRSQPLNIGVTTAGAEYESAIWWREYEFAKQVRNGSITSNTQYVAIWEADQKRVEDEPEYWKSREARVAANPSHEDLGGFLKDSAIVRELDKALADAAERPKYLRYHLNCPLKAQEDPIIDMMKWQASGDPGGDVDLRTWPEYDVDYLIKKWGLEHKTCWAGVDASWTTDLTAVVFVFPPPDETGIWTLLPFFFLPREKLAGLERSCRGASLSSWVDRGFIRATSGNSIDMREVVEKIRWGGNQFNLQAVPYDRMNFQTEALGLNEEGISCKEVPQNFLTLSYATKFVLSSYGDKKLRHGNNPVMNWMAACLQLQYDHKDNCQPSKPERMKSTKRIDGMQATVTALSCALVATSDVSVYESRGIRTL